MAPGQRPPASERAGLPEPRRDRLGARRLEELVAALGQKTVLEGKPAVAFPVRFNDGTVFLGPFQVGVVPPAF